MVSASLVTNHETQNTTVGCYFYTLMIEKPKNFRRNGIFPSLSIICLINRGKKKKSKEHIQITKRRIINM